jgi:superfamily II DNA or RNA helicase
MTAPELKYSYSDNAAVTVAARLAAEIEDGKPEHLDVVSGYLAVSLWPHLGDALESVERVRILLGKDWEAAGRASSEIEADIAHLVSEAIRNDTEPPRLPAPADAEAVAGLISFLERDSVEVKAWRGEGFLHAKAYILDGSVGVGSANFTGPGLSTNRELVMWRQDRGVVEEVQSWFDDYWASPDSHDYKEELLRALRDSPFGGTEYSPYQLLIRTLADRYGLDTPAELSQATFSLRWFQTDAVFRLIKLLSGPARGALLADAVGIGKTYMALGVIHHFLHQERESVKGRPVLLIIPASLRKMWDDVLDRYNLAWAVEIVHVQNLRRDTDTTLYSGADLVVIDEAHRLRGGRVWFEKVMEILRRAVNENRDPRVLLLSATPVNTGIRDLTNLLRVVTKNRRNVWAPEIPDFERYLQRVEKGEVDPYPLLDRSVVRRSRSDLVKAYKERRATQPDLAALKLPNRRLHHESYSYAAGAEDDVFATFADVFSSLRLAPYGLERFRRRTGDGDPGSEGVDGVEEIEASSLAGLYMTGLLKRFESSLAAVGVSLRRLDRVLDLFQAGLEREPPRLISLSEESELRRLLEHSVREDEDEETEDLDARIDELIDAAPALDDPDSYDIDAIYESIREDRGAIKRLLEALPPESEDGKIEALVDLLTRPMEGNRIGLKGRRVLVFTQFRDTAEYLFRRLSKAAASNPAVGTVEVLHGGSTPEQRDAVARTFDPGAAVELEASAMGIEVPRVLVSTDILAEGHNLQLAEAVVNYDLHWNPQVAVQRAGRVDRLNSPHEVVYLASFLPEDGLERILGLVARVNLRFGLYNRLGLADEPVTALPADQVVATSLEQLRRIYRDDETVLDEIEKYWTLGSTDYMRAPLEAFLRERAADEIRKIPRGVQSIKFLPEEWEHGEGVFIALAHGESDELEAHWIFYPFDTEKGWGAPLRDEIEIFRAIGCASTEPRAPASGSVPDGPSTMPGVLIDWDLLRSAAGDLAQELTARRNTAALIRGASERSAKIRTRLIDASDGLDVPALDPLLDRLEQVRIEDYDTQPGYDSFMDHLRQAERADDDDERARLIDDLAKRGLQLLGEPEDDDGYAAVAVDPDELRLTAWEILIYRDAGQSGECDADASAGTSQPKLV